MHDHKSKSLWAEKDEYEIQAKEVHHDRDFMFSISRHTLD
jgi:hypothetical protein